MAAGPCYFSVPAYYKALSTSFSVSLTWSCVSLPGTKGEASGLREQRTWIGFTGSALSNLGCTAEPGTNSGAECRNNEMEQVGG